jgi:hypothetical protein
MGPALGLSGDDLGDLAAALGQGHRFIALDGVQNFSGIAAQVQNRGFHGSPPPS